MAARILEVTDAAYHADPCASPSLSSSIAHILVTQSPRHGWLAHPRLGGQQRASTPQMDEGSILHKLLLGKGAQFEMVMADDWRTNAAKASRAEILEAGRIPILAHKFEALKAAAERIAKNAAYQGFPIKGDAEVAIEFVDCADRKREREVLCRCRIDMIAAGHVLLDVKKVATAIPRI
jgi:hypothetical protein